MRRFLFEDLNAVPCPQNMNLFRTALCFQMFPAGMTEMHPSSELRMAMGLISMALCNDWCFKCISLLRERPV